MPPPDPDPPCDCGGCREAAAIYSQPRREAPYGDRLAKRTADRAAQRRLEELELDPTWPGPPPAAEAV